MSKCLICLEDCNDVFCFLTCNCKSIYHIDCINQWLNYNRSCPTCSKKFKKYTSDNEELLRQAIFYNSIGRYNFFKKKYFVNYLK